MSDKLLPNMIDTPACPTNRIDAAFADDLNQEVLKSERLRVNILIAVTLLEIVLFISANALFSGRLQQVFHGDRSFRILFLCSLGLMVLYLAFERLTIGHHVRSQKGFGTAHRYVNALVEISIPSALLIGGQMVVGPVNTLFTPVAFLYAIFITLSILGLDFKLCLFTGAMAAVEYLGLAGFYLTQPAAAGYDPMLTGPTIHLLRAAIFLINGAVAGIVTQQIRRRVLGSFRLTEERNRIRQMFGQHVSPAVMEALLEQRPDQRTERRRVCVMFLDIRDFSGLAERSDPAQTVRYLDSLFDFMVEIVNRQGGIINKFLGDGFMAVFGAPLATANDCASAVRAAREIVGRVQRDQGAGLILPTRVGIGIHAGEAITGTIGPVERREYTVIGDAVNLASRIEQLNKQFGSQILVSQDVLDCVPEEKSGAADLGSVQIKGRSEMIHLHKLA